MAGKLPTMPAPGEDNPFDIARIAKERFGVDISPEARAQAEQQARTRQLAASGSGALQQLFAGLAGRPGSADAGIQSQREAIDADTTGAFDAKRTRTLQDVKFGDEQLDRARKQTIENTDFERQGAEYDDEMNPESSLSAMAREAAARFGMKLPPTTSYGHVKKTIPWFLEKLQLDRQQRESQWAPADQKYLATVGEIARGVLPPSSPLNIDGVSPKALQLGAQLTGAARGRENTMDRWRTPRGASAEKLGGFTGTLNHIDSLNRQIPGFQTGFLRNKVDRARWFASMDDPQRTALKGQLSALLSDYTLAMSGKASNEGEARRLQEFIPTVEDSPESLMDKMDGFQDWTKRNLSNWLDSYERHDYDVAEDREFAKSRGWLDVGGAPTPPPNRDVAPQQPPAQAGAPAASDPVRFEVDGRKATVPADKVQGFLQKYPNAKRVQ